MIRIFLVHKPALICSKETYGFCGNETDSHTQVCTSQTVCKRYLDCRLYCLFGRQICVDGWRAWWGTKSMVNERSRMQQRKSNILCIVNDTHDEPHCILCTPIYRSGVWFDSWIAFCSDARILWLVSCSLGLELGGRQIRKLIKFELEHVVERTNQTNQVFLSSSLHTIYICTFAIPCKFCSLTRIAFIW